MLRRAMPKALMPSQLPAYVTSLSRADFNLSGYLVSEHVRLDHRWQIQISQSFKLEAVNSFKSQHSIENQPEFSR